MEWKSADISSHLHAGIQLSDSTSERQKSIHEPMQEPTANDGLDNPSSRRESGAKARIPRNPLLRRLAKKYCIEFSTVIGTGPGGVIVRRDLEAIAGRQAKNGHALSRPQPCVEGYGG